MTPTPHADKKRQINHRPLSRAVTFAQQIAALPSMQIMKEYLHMD